MEVSGDEQMDWPLRPWLLAGVLGIAGLLIWLVTKGNDDVPWQMAAAALLFFGAIAAAFTLERDRWKEPLAFALLAGLVMAGLAWRATAAGDRYADEEYGFAAGVIATGLALPLFQAGFHRTHFATPYARVHDHVWSDAIRAAGSLAFVGAAWLLLLLMSELFHLLRIDLLRELMEEGWFGWTYSGAAFGAALGTLRNQLKIVGTLQHVAAVVLSILAVPLAIGLALFLVAMIVSGPEVLWEATRSATPVLLACAAGAWVLANAVLRGSDSEMSGSRVLRWAAFALALTILPLTVFAAISLGTRIDQHGLSPERLWGLVAIAAACAYGLAWLVALVRGSMGADWRERLRRANLHLAALICAGAFILALPILNFGAISAQNQIARLQSGEVAADEFDFAALRWDFGDPGRRALQLLARSGNAQVAELAENALAQTERRYRPFGESVRTRAEFALRVQPDDRELRRRVLDHLAGNPWLCQERCVALDLGQVAGRRRVAIVQGSGYQIVQLSADGAGVEPPEVAPPAVPLSESSVVEIREAPTRYIFIDGRRLPQPLDDAASPLEGQPPPR